MRRRSWGSGTDPVLAYGGSSFTVIYDACVLHPFHLRDLLVRLATRGLFRGRWTERILAEMVDSVLRRRPDLGRARLERTTRLMCAAVPDCLVCGWQRLEGALVLPDPDDRHVLAAAIRANAQVIVTHNVRDFPQDALEPYNIEAQTPDAFVRYLLDLAPRHVVDTVREMSAGLVAPPLTVEDVLERLERGGLPRSVAEIRRLARA